MKRVRLRKRHSSTTYTHRPVNELRLAGRDSRPARLLLREIQMLHPLTFNQLYEIGRVVLQRVHLYAHGKDFAISFVTDTGTLTITVMPHNLARLGQVMIDLAEGRLRHQQLEYNQQG